MIFRRGGWVRKNQYIGGGDYLKWWLVQFAGLRGDLPEKRGLIPQCTLWQVVGKPSYRICVFRSS